MGLTDYVAWPVHHARQAAYGGVFDRPARTGSTSRTSPRLSELLPILSLVSEIRMKNRLARTLLETYVGSHAGELILAGATRRGSGTTVRAAIMICDLRDFTAFPTTGRATTSSIFSTIISTRCRSRSRGMAGRS